MMKMYLNIILKYLEIQKAVISDFLNHYLDLNSINSKYSLLLLRDVGERIKKKSHCILYCYIHYVSLTKL